MRLSSIGVLWFALAAAGLSNTLHVPGDFPTIQDAIDAAVGNHDLILVAQGVYYENICFKGKSVRIVSDRDGDEQTIDYAPFTTLINGTQSGSVVSFTHGEGNDSLLQGFTLTNGSGTYDTLGLFGGGIYCSAGSSPTIAHCVICNNEGIYLGDASVEIEAGGGLFCHEGASPVLLNSLVYGNRAFGSELGNGGGIACSGGCSLTLINCTVYNNLAHVVTGKGGGIWCFNDSHVDIWNTIFAENAAFEAYEIWVGTNTTPTTVSVKNSIIMKENSPNPPPSTYVQPGCELEMEEVSDDDPRFKDHDNLDFGLSFKHHNPPPFPVTTWARLL